MEFSITGLTPLVGQNYRKFWRILIILWPQKWSTIDINYNFLNYGIWITAQENSEIEFHVAQTTTGGGWDMGSCDWSIFRHWPITACYFPSTSCFHPCYIKLALRIFVWAVSVFALHTYNCSTHTTRHKTLLLKVRVSPSAISCSAGADQRWIFVANVCKFRGNETLGLVTTNRKCAACYRECSGLPHPLHTAHMSPLVTFVICYVEQKNLKKTIVNCGIVLICEWWEVLSLRIRDYGIIVHSHIDDNLFWIRIDYLLRQMTSSWPWVNEWPASGEWWLPCKSLVTLIS